MTLAQQVWAWAKDARWCSARDAEVIGLELGDQCYPGLRPAFLQVVTAAGEQVQFFVPLSLRTGSPVDACDDGALVLEALLAGADGFEARVPLPDGLAPRRYTGEQSNTNIFFGDLALAKVFRRLEPGRNVDVELHDALAGSGTVAEVYGTWRLGELDLAIFLEALPDPADGYALACTAAQQHASFAPQAHALGSALARVHAVLAQRLGTATLSGHELAAQWESNFFVASREVPEVAAYQGVAREIFADCSSLETQRIHGDCHLGQVLYSQGTWRFVDFEGEPLKPLAERRRLDSPLRDVAGMLRSFAYAAAGRAPSWWLAECRTAFLSGYGLAEIPSELLAFELDKAAYEARYEARHRPDLLPVPLAYLADLSRLPPTGSSAS